MSRPVTLFTGQWADLPFEEICARRPRGATTASRSPAGATTWTSGRRPPTRPTSREKRAILEKHNLGCWALGAHLAGQCVGDRYDERLTPSPRPKQGQARGILRRWASTR
jgi:hypothetical protein